MLLARLWRVGQGRVRAQLVDESGLVQSRTKLRWVHEHEQELGFGPTGCRVGGERRGEALHRLVQRQDLEQDVREQGVYVVCDERTAVALQLSHMFKLREIQPSALLSNSEVSAASVCPQLMIQYKYRNPDQMICRHLPACLPAFPPARYQLYRSVSCPSTIDRVCPPPLPLSCPLAVGVCLLACLLLQRWILFTIELKVEPDVGGVSGPQFDHFRHG